MLPRVLLQRALPGLLAVLCVHGAKTAPLPHNITIPFAFAANSDGSYIAHTPNAGLKLSRDGAALELQNATKRASLGLRFEGGNRSVAITALDPLPGRANYFMGRDRTQWRTNVPQFERVLYRGIYPGIDLQFHGNSKRLEYDWLLAPGADPKSIRMSFEGIRSMELEHGDLVLHTEIADVREHRPEIFQDGRRLSGRFVLLGKNTVGFELDSYDKTQALVIDPIITYSTYLGGQDGDSMYAAAVDGQGNLIVGGGTLSPNFPTRNALMNPSANNNVQGFVAKINPRAAGGASLLWSTYIGGGDNFSYVLGVTSDALGNVLVTGTTAAAGFPLVHAYQTSLNRGESTTGCPNTPFDIGGHGTCTDAFVAKLVPTGDNIVYSTYLGGNLNDIGYVIAADAAGNAYVTGQTSSFDFPYQGSPYQATLKGPTDAFLTRFTADGSFGYSSYFGGDGEEVATAMAITRKGAVFLAGTTSSSSLPLISPFQTSRTAPVVGFIARLDNVTNGPVSLGYSTYLGGVSGSTSIASMVMDSDGNLWLAGGTNASDFPITTNAVRSQYVLTSTGNTPAFDIPSFLVPTFSGNSVTGDGFLTKMNPNAVSTAQLLYSTFLGGAYNDVATGVALDSSGRVVVTGVTSSYDFPVTGDALLASNGSLAIAPTLKVFLASVDPTLKGPAGLNYSTYLGGSANDFSTRIVTDSGGAIVVGQTRSRNFPIQNPYQAQFGGQLTPGILQGDGFITRFDLTQNSPIINSAANGASFQLGAGFAPGEIVTFKGVRLGPAQIIFAQLGIDGRLATQLGACQLIVDGIAAPLVHSLATQITAILPYDLVAKIGQTVNAQANCGGLKSNFFSLPIVDADPGVFSVSGGTGQGALLNQDGSYNSAGNPAALGSIVQIFVTGEGMLTPPGVDGRIETGPLSTIPKPAQNVNIFFAGVTSFDVPYIGVVPGQVDGLLQINVRVPIDAPTGNVDLQVQVGSHRSPAKLTVALK